MKGKGNIKKAYECYVRRQGRNEHPNGKTDNASRFYPSDEERRECCDSVRSPSRAYPWSYMVHCRSMNHIAELYEVDVKELRKMHREQQQKEKAKKKSA